MIALVTATMAEALDKDLPPLVEALRTRGAEVVVAAWDDPAVDWSRFEVAILRSTWDYVERFDEFMRWVDRTDTQTRLWNSAPVVRWNTDKHYLSELSSAGVEVVRTHFVEPGDRCPPGIGETSEAWVVKPAVGAGSRGAKRCLAAEVAEHVATLHQQGLTAMVQPYLPLIDERGETALVYLGDGVSLDYSHAFGKAAILNVDEVEVEGGFIAVEQISARTATSEELALGERVLQSTPVRALGPLAYARVDLVPTAAGPVLLELELTEPSLYFHTRPGSADVATGKLLRLVGS